MSGEREEIVLEKTTTVMGGRLPKGEQITFTFPAGTTDLFACALRNLERIHPDEHEMCWTRVDAA